MQLLSSEHKPPRNTAKNSQTIPSGCLESAKTEKRLQRNRVAPPAGASLDAIGVFGVGLRKLLNVNRDAVLNGLP